MFVFAFERESKREKERVCLFFCLREKEREREFVSVCVFEKERERVC